MNNLAFKNLYKKKHENFIVNEMSLKLDDNQDILNRTPNSIISQGEYYKKSGEKISDFIDSNNNNYEIYKIGNSECFLNSQGFAMAIIEFEEIDSDSIRMKYINSFHKSKGLMEDIFVNYLLKIYKTVISDNVQTSQGFYFYKKLCFNKDQYRYNFFIIGNNGDRKECSDCNDMDSTYGYDEKNLGYRYIIERL